MRSPAELGYGAVLTGARFCENRTYVPREMRYVTSNFTAHVYGCYNKQESPIESVSLKLDPRFISSSYIVHAISPEVMNLNRL